MNGDGCGFLGWITQVKHSMNATLRRIDPSTTTIQHTSYQACSCIAHEHASPAPALVRESQHTSPLNRIHDSIECRIQWITCQALPRICCASCLALWPLAKACRTMHARHNKHKSIHTNSTTHSKHTSKALILLALKPATSQRLDGDSSELAGSQLAGDFSGGAAASQRLDGDTGSTHH